MISSDQRSTYETHLLNLIKNPKTTLTQGNLVTTTERFGFDNFQSVPKHEEAKNVVTTLISDKKIIMTFQEHGLGIPMQKIASLPQ